MFSDPAGGCPIDGGIAMDLDINKQDDAALAILSLAVYDD